MPTRPPVPHGVPVSMADYWAIGRRRFWWIALPLFLCWSAIWGFSWFLPPTYLSEALILVEQQKVPENYVASNVTVDLQDRLQSMTQQILSRTRLQSTIERFHLYPPRRVFGHATASEDPVDTMRKDIKIDLVRAAGRAELTAFKIQYSAGSPELAQQVNSELTSLFIDENLKAQEQQSESTTGFLNAELADARAKLTEQETKVRAFKSSHFGDLPSQMQTNVQILSGLQQQLQSTQRNLDAARQQSVYLNSTLEQYESQPAAMALTDPGGGMPSPTEKELTDLRLQLADARAKYTEQYPDVIALKDKLAKTEKLIEDEGKPVPPPQDAKMLSADSGASKGDKMASPAIAHVQAQLKVNELEISDYQKTEKQIEAQIADYQARLNLTPQTEQELAEVSRGYEESMSNYNSLLQKQMQSQLATNLEERQQGQQFTVLDPPSLPTKPASPNHLKLSLAGLMAGTFLGLCLAALLEMIQPRVWKASDLEGVVPARLLVSVPYLSTPREERFRSAAQVVKFAVVTAMVIFILAGNLYAVYRG